MSIGFLVEEETPMIRRGPMVVSALTQMLFEVERGELDVMGSSGRAEGRG
jgi:ATP-binding protein involved in chromosome partitioning